MNNMSSMKARIIINEARIDEGWHTECQNGFHFHLLWERELWMGAKP